VPQKFLKREKEVKKFKNNKAIRCQIIFKNYENYLNYYITDIKFCILRKYYYQQILSVKNLEMIRKIKILKI